MQVNDTTLISSTTFDRNNICECCQFVLEYDCLYSSLECTWDIKNKECIRLGCDQIQVEAFFLQQSKRCSWIGMNYVSATTCNQLAGSKQYLCYYQNRYCPATNGTNCEPVDQLQACSSFDIITYSRLTCSALTNQVECTAGFQTFGPYLTLLLKNEMTKYFDSKKCSWMFLEFQNTCEDYSPSTQNYLNCYPFNRGTYNWDNKDVKHGSCVPCFQELLIVTILISMII